MSSQKRSQSLSAPSSDSDSSGGVALDSCLVEGITDMDDNESEAAIQQLMGFSAFGSSDKDKKRASKRQRLDSESSGLPPKPPATASNSTPLGTRSRSTMSAAPSTEGAPKPSIEDTTMTYAVTADEATSTTVAKAASIPLPPSPAPKTTTDSQVSPTVSFNPSANDFSPKPANAPKTTTYTAADIRSDPSYWTNISITTNATGTGTADTRTTRRDRNAHRLPYPDNDEIGYTNSNSGYTMTNRELNEYHFGKEEVQADGSVVKVYFKPSFLEDPWAHFK